MLTVADLIHLPFSPDLGDSGSAYACRWLACASVSPGSSLIQEMWHIAGGVAVELAFRRHLTRQSVPFKTLDITPFAHPNHYFISLGGHRCNIISTLVTRRSRITQIRRDPGRLLQAPARLPLEEFSAEGHKPDELYLFAFLLGVTAATQRDIKKAISAGQPVHPVHPLPEAWARPKKWVPLENLSLKSESETNIPVEIGGLDTKREYVTASFELPPRTRIPVTQEFCSLAFVHAGSLPSRRLGLHCPRLGDPYLIQPHGWEDVRVYGMEIILAGWLTQEEYRRKARVLNAGAGTFPADETPEKSLLVPLDELNALGGLLKRVRAWEAEKHRATSSS